MDINKEREAFEDWVKSKGRVVERFSDGSYKSMTLDKEWSAWQAAKAQAVPDLGELQERIAGHQYYHDEHSHMVVDMDDVVREISGFDSWKAQAVPEGFVLVPKHPNLKILKAMSAEMIKPNNGQIFIGKVYKAMLEAAQEPAND